MSALADAEPLGWLARLPNGWQVRRFKFTATEHKQACGLRTEPPPMLSVSGYDGVVLKEYDDENRKRRPEDLVTYLLVHPDQLVLNTMWLNFRGLGVARERGLVSPAYRAYDLGEDWLPSFAHHLLRSDPYVGEYTRVAFGIRPNSLTVSRDDFAGLPVPLPPLPTQRAIAAFLDRKTAAIDDLIDKKERLIKLLAEKRAALIHRAVTKGLDDGVPMKDSGVPWIGEIPAHWEVKRLKHLVVESVAGPYGSSLTKAMYVEIGYRVYGQQQVIPDDFSVGDYYISPEKFATMRRYEVYPGDLLVSVMGTIGRVAVVPAQVEPGIINPRLVRYRVDATVAAPRFLQLAMLSDACQAPLLEAAQGSTMDGLNMGILGELRIALPPLAEQQRIDGKARAEAGRLDGAVHVSREQIDKLREYRQALITAAVTGQIEVPAEYAR